MRICHTDKFARYLLGSLMPSGSTPGKVPKYLYGDGDWAGDEERKRSTTGVTEIIGGHPLDAIAGRAVWRGGGVLRLQPRDRVWIANVPLPDRGVLRGDSTSVVRLQFLPRDCPQDRHRQAPDTKRSDTCGHRNGGRKGSSC